MSLNTPAESASKLSFVEITAVTAILLRIQVISASFFLSIFGPVRP